jgi:vancomycin resistance protein YoaR
MTTPASAPAASRGFPFGKLLVGVVAGFTLALGFGVGALLAYQGQYAERIYPGVTVDGVAVAGLTRDAARATLEQSLARYGRGEAVLVVQDGEVRIPYAALGRRADVDTLVDLAWSVGRSLPGPLDRAAEGVRSLLDGTRIGPLVLVDAEAVAREVARAAEEIDRAPVDATAAVTEEGFATTPAAAGRGLPQVETAQALLEQLAVPDAPSTLEVPVELVPIEPAVDDADAALAVAAATRIAQDVSLAKGKESWTIEAATVRPWIRFAATPDGYGPVVDETAPSEALASLARKIDRKAKDASFLVGRGNATVGVVAAKNGRALDVGQTAPLVARALNARAGTVSSDPPPEVEAVIAVVPPALSTEEAEKVAPRMVRLSTWTTKYEVSERNGYGANISIPTNDINGYVVQPGAVFDFWEATGPVTYERGYRDGGVILNGRTEPTGALAGGICSCSTTLFNAAARAGLEILERANHYYYISRYPTGLDATVWKTGNAQRSMRFRNDTDDPILVRGFASPGVVRFEIWGPPTGRTVSFSAPTIRNVVRATDSTQYTTSLKPGQRKRIEYPVDGMQVWVSRTVRDGTGAVLHSDTWYSNYKRVNGILLIGKASTTPAPSPAPTPPAAPSPAPTPTPAPSPAP